ncbi:MAG: class I SAM-dependent methyltransferase [Streptosporangiales bacterium]|nr:class I SAM-dependent methyltransferase [Streptosporangiales bacterium]
MLARLWDAYQEGRPTGELAELASGSEETFYLSVIAHARGEPATAARHAEAASSADPGRRAYREAARYLADVARHGRRDVYASPEGFAAFIRGGGNVALYEATSRALCDRYRRHRPATLLDVGAGDGLALLPALTDDVGHVDVVEPSRAMLDVTADALRRRGTPHRTLCGTAGELMAGAAPWSAEARWSLAQSTFALHALAAAERAELLSWLRTRVDRLLVVEFDVPPRASACEPAWFAHVVSRYEDGLAEYEGEEYGYGVVAQGFLMPVMFGYFDPAVDHHEQPIDAWADDLARAGFGVADPQPLCDYWWAPAYLLEASVAR